MTSRKIRKNLNKELMFNKIMPSNTATEDFESNTHKIYNNNEDITDTSYQPMPMTLNDFMSGNSDKHPEEAITKPDIFEEDIVKTPQDNIVPEKNNAPLLTLLENNNDNPQYINVIKQALYLRIDELINMFKCCDCDLCKQTIMLKVLNSAKPEYVYKRPSEVNKLIEENNYPDINQPIIHAIFKVKANPPHDISE